MELWLRKAVFGLVSASIGFCVAMWTGHFFVENRLQWETLVAGILAIGAAAWTVNTSLATDVRAQARHEELVRLQTRHDRLEAQRALAFWTPYFKAFRERYPRMVEALAPFSELEHIDPFTEEEARLIGLRNTIFAALNVDAAPVRHLERILTPQMSQLLQEIREFQRDLSEIEKGLIERDHLFPSSVKSYLSVASGAPPLVHRLEAEANAMVRELT